MKRGFNHTVGILGGVGPAATAYAFSRLIAICQSDYGAVQDSDFPRVVVLNLPLEGMDEHGFTDQREQRDSLKSQLELGYASLKRAGTEIVYMACNTLQGYQRILGDTGLKEVNIMDASAKHIKSAGSYSSVAVLSSEATRRDGLYEKSLKKAGLSFYPLSDKTQEVVDKLILAAMGGRSLASARKQLKDLCLEILGKADAVILGCTELSLLADQRTIDKSKVIDAQEIALRQLLKRSKT